MKIDWFYSRRIQNKLYGIGQFPLIKIIVALSLTLFPVVLLFAFIIGPLYKVFFPTVDLGANVSGTIITIIVIHYSYQFYVKNYEKRIPRELDYRYALREIAQGMIIGSGLLTLSIAFLFLMGHYHISALNHVRVLLPVFAMSLSSGYIEELITRGILFRIVEEWLGTWTALLISALVFGLLHGLNPNATVINCLAIAIEAGVLLGAVFILTRRLWMAMGMHFAWNFTQGGIFGAPVSGFEIEGLFAGKITGPELISGGEFGPEGSLFVLILGFACGVVILFMSWKKGNILRPIWVSRKISSDIHDALSSRD